MNRPRISIFSAEWRRFLAHRLAHDIVSKTDRILEAPPDGTKYVFDDVYHTTFIEFNGEEEHLMFLLTWG